MPFSIICKLITQKYKLIMKKRSCSLQVLRLHILIIQKCMFRIKLKRVFSFTSQKGSITLEAAITTTVFVISVVSIITLFGVLSLQQNIHVAMENVGRKMSQTIYYADKIKSIGENSKVFSTVNRLLSDGNEDIFSDDEKQEIIMKLQEVSFNTYVYGQFISEIKADYINKSYVYGGVFGLDFTKSEYDSENDEIDIVLSYKIKIPFISGINWTISDCQRVRVKVWNGTDITRNKDIVYITKNGEVYHLTKTCSHLKIDITKTAYGNIKNIKNNSGVAYNKCKQCGFEKILDSSIVYITEYGESYHESLSCAGISRSVIYIDKSKTGSLRLCKDCEKIEVDIEND